MVNVVATPGVVWLSTGTWMGMGLPVGAIRGVAEFSVKVPAGVTVYVAEAWAERVLLVAVTVKEKTPAAVGVPEMGPSGLRIRPWGRLPVVMA